MSCDIIKPDLYFTYRFNNREDGKDSMKFYTDSMYFFELWCQEMKKDTEHQKKELKRKRQRQVKLKFIIRVLQSTKCKFYSVFILQ